MNRLPVLYLVLLVVVVTLLLTGCGAEPTAAEPPLPIETGVESDAWAVVPAGEFLAGQFNEPVFLEEYEIMLTPVTNRQYARYLTEALAAGSIRVEGDEVVGYYPGEEFDGARHEQPIKAGEWLHMPLNHPATRITFDGENFTIRPGYEEHPVTMVSWFGARAYCDFYGRRLPTELEWEKAARGTDGRAYPWGDEITPAHANYYHSGDPFERPGEVGDTTPVGFYNGGRYGDFQTADARSPFGLYDMAGNVGQWTADNYEESHYRYFRGGSFARYGYDLRVWTRNNAGPDYASPGVGFRCAR